MKRSRWGFSAICLLLTSSLILVGCSSGSDDAQPSGQPDQDPPSGPGTVNPPNDSPGSGTPPANPTPGTPPANPTPGTPPTNPGTNPPTGGGALGTFNLIGSVVVSSANSLGVELNTANAEFSQLQSAVAINASDLQFFTNVDQCNSLASITPPTVSEPDITGVTGLTSTSISAGQVLTLTSQNGTYASLSQVVDNQDIRYENQQIGASPAGLSLTLDIPGDQYPAVQGLALPAFLAAPSNITQQLSSIQTNSTLQWTPPAASASTQSILLVSAFAVDSSGAPTGFTCTMNDDGNFVVPADILNGLNSGFSPLAVTTLRLTFTWFDVGSGALLLYGQISADSSASTSPP